jgi:hypothetical protein
MRFARFSAALIAAACLNVSAHAQSDSSTRQRAFVEQVALNTGDNNGLARWDSRVCVGVAGLAQAQSQELINRISGRAGRVGLSVGEPGCQANIMVIFAPDSDVITRQIVDQRRDVLGFSGGDDGRITAGREAMEAFANTPRPIRWWHISSRGVGSIRPDAARSRQILNQQGARAAVSGADDTGAAPTGQGSSADIEGMDAVRIGGSRARAEVRNDLTYALVVVDARRVANVPASAWMDYVALVALAQVDPDGATGSYPTLLNLFVSTPADPSLTALTPWDLAYLDALYDARGETVNRQMASIARRMAERAPN